MIAFLEQIDYEILLLINGANASWLDQIMIGFSSKWLWIPFYIFLFYTLKKSLNWKGFAFLILGIIILIASSDLSSVHLFKNVFLRYRPCHNLLLSAQLNLPSGCGGLYGFVSSHAANTAALAGFMWFLLKEHRYLRIFLIFYVLSNTYSRVYLGVHFPSDVLVGGLLGIAIGVIYYQIIAPFLAKESI